MAPVVMDIQQAYNRPTNARARRWPAELAQRLNAEANLEAKVGDGSDSDDSTDEEMPALEDPPQH